MIKNIVRAAKFALIPVGAFCIMRLVGWLSDFDVAFMWYAAIGVFIVGAAALISYSWWLINDTIKNFQSVYLVEETATTTTTTTHNGENE